jgi:CheY-like chemotaxis protein
MPRILLVEDDQLIADIYRKKFESSGFDVVNAVTGRQVLKLLADQRFDIVLLDLVIPELSGMEVLKEIRTPRFDPNIKVVVFSNLSNPEDREQAVRIGANGFISKTEFAPSQVVEEVNRYLRQFGEQCRNESRRQAVSAAEPESAPVKKRSILFIEDEPVFVDMFTGRLEKEGYTVSVEMNGLNGFNRAVADDFDLIITDAMLPGMNGSELIQRLKADPKTSDIPIFVISASLDETDLQDILVAGATKTFQKTQIVPSELAEEVGAFFESLPVTNE